ncbi:MAG: HAD-IC family P-type ATPase [Syntrophorhabdales bacterium]
MVRIVHAAVDGRVRFRVEGLHGSHELKRRLEEGLSRDDDITHVSASPLTGNVLVLYTSSRTASEIKEEVKGLLPRYDGAGQGGQAVEKAVPHRPGVPARSLRKRLGQAKETPPDGLWHFRQATDAITAFGASEEAGLSNEAYRANLSRFGPNILPESVPRSAWSIVLEQFKSLPVLLLGVAAGVSLLTGGFADAVAIMSVVGINAVIGYVTESRSEKTIRSLKSLVTPTALVKRDGEIAQVGAEDVVPGDILVLRPGSYVAADARLVVAQHLSVDESALTGESMPAHKTADVLDEVDLPLADRDNMVYMGTLVTGGQGLAVVVATGPYTEIGRIQILVGETRPPATPMERQLDHMGTRLAIMSAAVCAGVFGIGLLRGYGFLRMLKMSMALAVAAVPEGLPAVATTTLALGIRSMRRHHVLVRRLEAIETLGSVQTICLDKTGTLTLNRMTVTRIFTGNRDMQVREGRFTSPAEETNPYTCDELLMLLHVGVLCNESEIFGAAGTYTVTGSPTENALIHVALAAGVNGQELRAAFPLINVIHRSETRNVMLTVHSTNGGAKRLLAVKGSPPEVLAACTWYMKDGTRLPLSDEAKGDIQTAGEEIAGQGLRALGLAQAVSDDSLVLLENGDITVRDMVWLGIVGMTDPVRDGVKDLIAGFHGAGIDTVMITGDQSATAYAVGKELDLADGGDINILDSRHLTDMPTEVLKGLTRGLHVFARVSPAHKLRIVQILQEAGRVVGMTGDGINDAPALKAAAIGIAMGHTGTDVAREVADIVLEDDNLETMLIAVSEGRTIYNNIRKALHYLLSTNMSEIMVTAVSVTAGLGEPLTAMQLLWINLVSDIFPGLALALEAPEPDVLLRAPRDPAEEILQYDRLKGMLREAAVISAGSLGAYGYGVARYGQGPQAGTMAFLSLTVGQLLHALTCRFENKTIFDRDGATPNRYLTSALVGTFALQGIAMVVPGLRRLLGISRIGMVDGLVTAGGAILPLFVNEAIKKTTRGAV